MAEVCPLWAEADGGRVAPPFSGWITAADSQRHDRPANWLEQQDAFSNIAH